MGIIDDIKDIIVCEEEGNSERERNKAYIGQKGSGYDRERNKARIKPRDWKDLLQDNYDLKDGYRYPQWFGNIYPKLPRQGYKLRINSMMNEGRNLIKELSPVLNSKNVPHKIIPKKEAMKQMRDIQKHKFITIYPPAEEWSIKNGQANQKFYKENPKRNIKSVNVNYKNSERILELLIKILKNKDLLTYDGPISSSDERYKKTRISYRYGIIVEQNGSWLDGSPIEKGELVDEAANKYPDVRGSGNWRKLKGLKDLT
jgi:hypothetical protein